MKLETLLRQKFAIEIGGKQRYDVYPQIETMIDKPLSHESKQFIDKVFEGRSIPIARRLILYHYLDAIMRQVGASKSGQIDQTQIN